MRYGVVSSQHPFASPEILTVDAGMLNFLFTEALVIARGGSKRSSRSDPSLSRKRSALTSHAETIGCAAWKETAVDTSGAAKAKTAVKHATVTAAANRIGCVFNGIY